MCARRAKIFSVTSVKPTESHVANSKKGNEVSGLCSVSSRCTSQLIPAAAEHLWDPITTTQYREVHIDSICSSSAVQTTDGRRGGERVRKWK